MRRFILFWAVAAFAAGCGSGASGTGGGGGSSFATGPNAFLGVWQMSGVVAVTLSSSSLTVGLPLEGTQVISGGTGADTVEVQTSNECSFVATVKGTEATIADGTVCTVLSGTQRAQLTFHGGTLTFAVGRLGMSAQGDAAVDNLSGSGAQGSGPFVWDSVFTQ